MKRSKWIGSILLAIGLTCWGRQAQAVPGQTPEEVTLWLQSHATLKPAPGEKLLIRRSNTPSQRFTFQASLLPVGKIAKPSQGGIIRTEEFSFFDMVNGVNRARLEESLRILYGPLIYQDYLHASVVYAYPNAKTLQQAANEDAPLLAAVRGEVREGDRYAYWLEVVKPPQGPAYSGKMVVFLKNDVPKLKDELQNR